MPDGQDQPEGVRGESGVDRVQCPNCCRMAPVTHRDMGLLFYKCELCLSVGAAPEPPAALSEP